MKLIKKLKDVNVKQILKNYLLKFFKFFIDVGKLIIRIITATVFVYLFLISFSILIYYFWSKIQFLPTASVVDIFNFELLVCILVMNVRLIWSILPD